jgi:hypothetical protein
VVNEQEFWREMIESYRDDLAIEEQLVREYRATLQWWQKRAQHTRHKIHTLQRKHPEACEPKAREFTIANELFEAALNCERTGGDAA